MVPPFGLAIVAADILDALFYFLQDQPAGFTPTSMALDCIGSSNATDRRGIFWIIGLG